MNMNAVGIDVSKRKSTIAVLRPGGEVLMKPFDIPHKSADFQTLVNKLKGLDGETRIVMECTGHYYEPVARELAQADFFVSAVNPQIINNFQGQDNPLRKVKTDKADSVKIARYTLDSWANLKQYTLMDELRSQLKTMNRQFDFYTKHKTAMKNNLIALIDQTYPGANTYFDSPARDDGSQKWVDFLDTYWHVDCVRKMSLNAFTDHYQKWCCRRKYNFSKAKAEEIYGAAKELIPVLPKDNFTKCIIKQAVAQVNAASQTVERLRALMNETASKLPEYPVVSTSSIISTCSSYHISEIIAPINISKHDFVQFARFVRIVSLCPGGLSYECKTKTSSGPSSRMGWPLCGTENQRTDCPAMV